MGSTYGEVGGALNHNFHTRRARSEHLPPRPRTKSEHLNVYSQVCRISAAEGIYVTVVVHCGPLIHFISECTFTTN